MDEDEHVGPRGAPTRQVACFHVTKHSWRGKYKRIFVVCETCITTLNPVTFEETNRWDYGDEFVDIAPSTKSDEEFVITTKKKDSKKTSTTNFSSDYRAELLTATQAFRTSFAGKAAKTETFNAFKMHWSETRKEVLLTALPDGLAQVSSSGAVLAKYPYRDIEAICLVSDYPGAFCVFSGGFGRMHMFALDKRDELLRLVSLAAGTYTGLQLQVKKKTVTHDQFRENRFGKFSNDVAVTSLAEFPVSKLSPRHPDAVSRILCFSETCILERDPASYAIVTCRPLNSVFAVVRCPRDPQRFSIEYLNGQSRTYLSTERDPLLASLVDSVRANGRGVCVQMTPTDIGERYQPVDRSPDEEVESSLLKFVGTPGEGVSFELAVRRFNSNVDYSGLIHSVTADGWFKENKEKLITNALLALLTHGENTDTPEHLAGEFLAIRRLAASKAGFRAFSEVPGFKEKIGGKVVKALARQNDGVTHAALDMLCTLMQPMHDNYDLAQEKQNKLSLLVSKPFIAKLLELLKTHADAQTGALVVSQLLDFVTFTLCAPYSETTDGAQFDTVLAMVADLGRSLFRLFEHPSMAIVKAAGLIMKAIIEEGDEAMCSKMQSLALAEGALLRHLITALFTQSTDNRMLTHRQLSRHLVALWMEKNPTTEALIARILPAGLLENFRSKEEPPEVDIDRMHVRDTLKVAVEGSKKAKVSFTRKKLDDLVIHWRSRSRVKTEEDSKRPVVLRRRRQRVEIQANWEYFYYQFNNDHSRADLIWNFKTREELKEALDAELRAFLADKDLRGKIVISWNHTEFEVRYPSLAEEVKIGDHFLRLLLEDDPKTTKIHNPPEFFNDLYHRFLLTTKPAMKSMCLQAMAVVYGHCHEQIGHFNDTEYICHMLNRCEDHLERDRLLHFLNVLLLNKKNVKLFIDAGGVRTLVDLVTLAHLHTTRATTPMQTTMIEASSSQLAAEEPEWYYNTGEKKEGPVGLATIRELFEKGVVNKETKLWAQGMEGWRALRMIPQLKWTLGATGTPLLNFSELAVLCLNMLIRICEYYPSRDEDGAVVRPLPRCKRMLSEANCLPHIIQLLLTFDPTIVEKVAVLLTNIMDDNPVMPRLYLTGVFYFVMMYTGSNLLPIARFLKETHNGQAYQSEHSTSRSVLANLLPSAMICFLDNYGSDKFASTFLGEFDTPEAIWGAEMRRLLIQKIALHLADFTPRLLVNTRALYQYCPIPLVSYPELENELFCNIYYLRHLCNEDKFPEWPITNHIDLLKDILLAWKKEVEKKPASMSLDDAYEVLGLEAGQQHDTAKVRKAYFKMSMKYHPDKNPEGRDMFEKINKAYEFVSSKENRDTDGPKPENIVLILRAQSILFKRYTDVLQPYKYAGYPMLMTTIERETLDDNLFAGNVSVLRSACELAFLTVKCSPLNAEEMRRDGGIEQLASALSRVVSVVASETSETVPAVQVCIHILRCFAAAAAFKECRERIIECAGIMKDLSRCLWFKGAQALTSAAVDCVCAFSVDSTLQQNMLHVGVVWHILHKLFGYDATLDESGVEKDDSTHVQEFVNNNAKVGVRALARLGGYRKAGPDATPPNTAVQGSLGALLTPYMANMLSDENPVPLLKLLNSNCETPYLMWDNATRAELTDFIEKNQDSVIRTGEQDETFGASFVFSLHRDEVIIAGVFVRIYNEQPTFVLRNPKEFTVALLEYIGKRAAFLAAAEKPLAEGEEGPTPERIARTKKVTVLALESLRNVIRGTQGVELNCNGHFKMLFGILRLKDVPKMQTLTLEVIAAVCGNKDCVADIAASSVLVFLLFTLHTLGASAQLALETLHALVSNSKCVVEIMQSGGLIYLLDHFCSGTNPAVREATAALFAKMMGDKLHGPKIRILLSKFLPPIFMDAMRDNPEASVTMFENKHENPELIWNDEARNKVKAEVRDLMADIFRQQQENPALVWRLPEDFEVVYESVAGEVVVGGVFLRLLIKQPNWVFRKPKEFLVAIMERYVKLITKTAFSGDDLKNLEVISEAISALLRAQSDLASHVPSLGHINKIVLSIMKEEINVQSSGLCVLNELMNNAACVRNLASVPEAIAGIKAAMKNCTTACLPRACDLVKKVYEAGAPPLIGQAIETKFIQYLLELLKDGLDRVENAKACKAHIVNALKAMTRDLDRGEEVAHILDKCPWWASYKDQKHDLFITNGPVAGYLTGPTTTTIAGYLTGPTVGNVASSTAPPELDVHDTQSSKRGNPDL